MVSFRKDAFFLFVNYFWRRALFSNSLILQKNQIYRIDLYIYICIMSLVKIWLSVYLKDEQIVCTLPSINGSIKTFNFMFKDIKL